MLCEGSQMMNFFKYFVFGVFLFDSSSAMESRQAIELDNFYPESPSIHTYNGFVVGLRDIKLLSQSELNKQTIKKFVADYYLNKPKSKGSLYRAKDLNCTIDVDISKFRTIFDIPYSGSSPEFYMSIRFISSMIEYDKDTCEPVDFPLFRPHYAYYNPRTIGIDKAANFIRQYGTAFGFVDAYCKTRTCYIDAQSGALFSNQCWNSAQQNFSIHTDGQGNVRLSCNTPVIDAVKWNAFANNSCAVFYASKLPAGLSSKYEREIFGLILVLNESDERTFSKDLESAGLSKALRNNPTLSRSNTALEIFPNLWK